MRRLAVDGAARSRKETREIRRSRAGRRRCVDPQPAIRERPE